MGRRGYQTFSEGEQARDAPDSPGVASRVGGGELGLVSRQRPANTAADGGARPAAAV